MKKIYLFIPLFFCFFCKQVLPESVGRARDIIVVTPYKDSLEMEISFILEEVHYTPQPEKEYRVKYVPCDKFDAYSRFHTILVCLTPADSLYQVYFSSLRLLDSFTLYRIDTLFAKDQVILLLLGKEVSSLKEGLRKYREKIKQIFKIRLLQRLYDYTYVEGFNREAMQHLRKYGFNLKVPARFILIERYSSQHFVYLIAHEPDRNIFIYWEDKPREIDPGNLFYIRDSLTQIFYNGDYVERTLSVFKEWKFKNYKGYRLEGVWQNEKFTIGGPFVSYVFNTDNRFYFIDAIVFEPGKKKLSFLNQMEVILLTFQPLK